MYLQQIYKYIHCKYYIILLYTLCIYNKYLFQYVYTEIEYQTQLGYLKPKSEPYLKYMQVLEFSPSKTLEQSQSKFLFWAVRHVGWFGLTQLAPPV